MKKAIAFVAALSVSNLAMAGNCKAPDSTSIADIAAGNSDFSTLVAAVMKTGLLKFLGGNRNLTVFAPTNAAFDATAQAIFMDDDATGLELVDFLSKEELTVVLKYHIAPGERDSGDVLASNQIRTFAREFLFPSLDGETPFINNSEITGPDNFACNGVVHIIEGEVLLPPTD